MDDEGPEWQRVRDLGQGGFGVVTLFKRRTGKEYIAIKRCYHRTRGADVSSSTMDRWKTEVLMMAQLQHENVVRSVGLPPELQPDPMEPPVLAMEYCEGGDLRKILNQPQNCCGLRESEIRRLVLGIGSAIEYLHGKKIIHRDLKPENIVLKKTDEKIVYKIIDLGYVKQLDNSSICTSFVGTQQYLAPELNDRHPYTKTMDYWSFGTLIFECITGRRPFLPDATPVQWHDNVQRKSPDDICAHFNEKREVIFSKKLYKPNQLCRPIEMYFEEWLRLMLRWDNKNRGGGFITIQGKKRPKCFFLMEQIMSLKVFHIFCAEANLVISICVREEHTIRNVQEEIKNVTHIEVEDQLIIQANGQLLDGSQPAFCGCTDPFSDDVIVFLFSQTPVNPDIIKKRTLPIPVQTIVKERDVCMIPKEQKKVWARAVLWCSEQNRDFKRLMLSQRAALLCILRYNQENNKEKGLMIKEMDKLSACIEQFQKSLEVDLCCLFQHLNSSGEDNNSQRIEMSDRWREIGQQVEDMRSMHEQVHQLDAQVEKLSKKVVNLQKSKSHNQLDEIEKQAKELYSTLTAPAMNERPCDQEEMAKLVCNCFKEMTDLCSMLHKHISKVIGCLSELHPVMPTLLSEKTKKIGALRKQVLDYQQQRQREIWELLENPITYPKPNSSQTQPPTALNERPFQLLGSGTSLLSSMANSNMESLHLVNDCKANSQRLQSMLDSLIQDHNESMSFLEGTLDA